MPDSKVTECYECGSTFNTLRRRHHCRVCGQIFCWRFVPGIRRRVLLTQHFHGQPIICTFHSRCCRDSIPGHLLGRTGALRCCKFCWQVVQTPDKGLVRSRRSLRSAATSRETDLVFLLFSQPTLIYIPLLCSFPRPGGQHHQVHLERPGTRRDHGGRRRPALQRSGRARGLTGGSGP